MEPQPPSCARAERPGPPVRCALIALCAAIGFGCAGVSWDSIDRAHRTGDALLAVQLIEQNKAALFGERAAFLYTLEMGTLWLAQGRYADSNRFFQTGAEISDDLYTQSVSASAISFITNDRVLPYYGESYERALLHVFSGLNYALLGDLEAAVVEARRVDEVLSRLKTDSAGKNVYKEDGFARYLTAMFYEERGNWNDAVVAYRQALRAYTRAERLYGVTRPRSLLPAALHAATERGGGAAAELRETYGSTVARILPEGFGEAVVLHYNGLAPVKAETFFEVSFGRSWAYVSPMRPKRGQDADVDAAFAAARSIAARQIIRVAFPKYVTRRYVIRGMEVHSAASAPVRGELVENVGAIAVRSLEDRRSWVWSKAIARAAFKYAVSRGLCRKAQKKFEEFRAALTCAALEATRIATERADVRGWRTVPDQILLATHALPAGQHDLGIRFIDERGRLVTERTIPGVQVFPGERTFVTVRTVE